MTATMDRRESDSGSAHLRGTDHEAQRADGIAMALFATAWPLLLGNLLNSLTGTGMSIWFSRLMGDRAVAVVSFFFPIMFFLVSLVMSLVSGATVVAGKAYGAGDAAALDRLTKTSLFASAILGVVLCALGALFLGPLLDAMDAPVVIRSALETYAWGMFAFIPLLFVFLAFSALLRGVGQARLASRMVAITSVLTLALVPLFVIAGGGFDGYGTAAYGAASMVAHVAMFAYAWRHLRKHPLPISLRPAVLVSARFDRGMVVEILKIGLPSSLQMNLTALSHVTMMSLIVQYGERTVAGFGAANQVVSYVQYPAYSLGIAASILCAQAIGAGNKEIIRRLEPLSIATSVLVGAIVVGVTWACSRPVLGLFLSGREALGIATEYLGISLIVVFFSGVTASIGGLLRAEGDAIWPSIIGLAAIWGVQIPLAHLLKDARGVHGIWWSFPAGAVAGFVATAIYYAFRRKRAALVCAGSAA